MPDLAIKQRRPGRDRIAGNAAAIGSRLTRNSSDAVFRILSENILE